MLQDLERAEEKHEERVEALTPEIYDLAGGKGSGLGTGGMVTKLGAAKICMDAGCDMIIANGSNPTLLYALLDGMDFGTRFCAPKKEEET